MKVFLLLSLRHDVPLPYTLNNIINVSRGKITLIEKAKLGKCISWA